jgi:hypothetical protein
MGAYIGRSKAMKNNLALLEAGRNAQVPVILWGPPGVGKTAVVRALAEKYGLPLFILVASTLDPSEINGLPAIKTVQLPDGTDVTITDNTLQFWAEELMRKGKGILFFDEASTAMPSTQAALLSVLQGRLVGRHTLPDDVWMIAAANEAKDAADGWELAPPMANRFLHVNYQTDINDWYEGMTVAWNKPVSDKELEERSKIVAFLKAYPQLANSMPKEDTKAGKAWPSFRSWDNLSKVLPALETVGVRTNAIEGLVGPTASDQFAKWERTIKLPNYDAVLANPEKIDWEKLNAGETYIVLNMIIGRMTSDNAAQSAEVFRVASEKGKKEDICVSLIFPLSDKIHSVVSSKPDAIKIIVNSMKPYLKLLEKAKLN